MQKNFLDFNISHVSILYDGGRSGSIFLQSLFDGHSEVITFPSTLLIGGLTGIHFDDFFCANAGNTPKQIAINFTKVYQTAFDSNYDSTASRLSQLGDHKDQKIEVDKDRFIDFFIKYFDVRDEISYINVFNGAHLAWAQAQGKKLGENVLIVHALHTPEDKMKMYCENFPESKHLVCIRNPIVSHNSRFIHHIKRHKLNNKNSDFFDNIEQLNYPYNMTRDVLFALKIIGKYAKFEKVRGVRNEDLHIIPESTVNNLCKFLEMEFEPQLLESTFFGLKHWGDDTIDPRNGFSKSTPSDFKISKSSFKKQDVALIEDLINDRILHFRYSRLTPKRNISARRLKKITKWEEESIYSILGKKTYLAKLAIYSRIFGANFHKLFIQVLSRLINESDSKIIIKWAQYVDMRVDLMKSYIAENKDNPEPKFGLI